MYALFDFMHMCTLGFPMIDPFLCSTSTLKEGEHPGNLDIPNRKCCIMGNRLSRLALKIVVQKKEADVLQQFT